MAREGQKEKLYSTVLWRIENLDVWESEFHPRCIESCQFKLNNYNLNNFNLSLLLDKNDRNRGVSLYFHEPTSYTIKDVECEWLIMGRDGMPILKSTMRRDYNGRLYMLNPPTYLNLFMNRNSTFLPNGAFNVQLRIFKTDFIKAEHVSLVSRIEAPAESFVWHIERFSSFQIDEKAVTSVKLGDAIFKLIFFLRGDSVENADVNFRIVAENPLNQSLKVTLSLLDQNENKAMVVEEILISESCFREQIWLLSKFFSRRKMLERGSDLLHGEDLRIFCKFTSKLKYNLKTYLERYYSGPANLTTDLKMNDDNVSEIGRNPKTIVSTISKRKIQTSPQSLNQLDTSKQINYIERNSCGPANLTTDIKRKDNNVSRKTEQNPKLTISKGGVQTSPQSLNQLDTPKKISLSNTILGEALLSAYSEQILNDFELRSGDVSFPVHKLVLSATSPVFKAMFCGDLKESGSKSMDVPDLDVHTLGRMLTFVYGGALDDLEWKSAAKLYYAADKYELLSLKQQCSAFLRYNLTVSNVSDILELADRHQDSELTSHVHEFIGDNFKEVIASAEWDKFLERGSLAGKTMKEVLQKSMFK